MKDQPAPEDTPSTNPAPTNQSGKDYDFSSRPVDRPLKKVAGVSVLEMKLRTEVPATENLSTAGFRFEEPAEK